ncbi:hypothetical protein LOK49_LG03G00191 [Camellia lanceoleosa]|uniref:Uncharacterized protein n=1 Tax=Camellia lanceoleosa TaxID=1840588 RepID=A0ACC0I914_9ERIC|nr:hypothetical protein LOK49_LG03G00191 [Camellia lanceoleosa]
MFWYCSNNSEAGKKFQLSSTNNDFPTLTTLLVSIFLQHGLLQKQWLVDKLFELVSLFVCFLDSVKTENLPQVECFEIRRHEFGDK